MLLRRIFDHQMRTLNAVICRDVVSRDSPSIGPLHANQVSLISAFNSAMRAAAALHERYPPIPKSHPAAWRAASHSCSKP